MINLIEGQSNTVWVKIESAINLSGFQLVLAANGVLRTISTIQEKTYSFEYSAAEVANTSTSGTYGTLLITDGTKEYLKFLPLFVRVPESESYKAIGHQTIYLTIATTFESSMASDSGSSGSGSGGSSDYVTQAQLQGAVVASNKYTDDKVENIQSETITETPITIVNPTGETVEMTIQQAVQEVVNVQTQVETAMETHLQGGVVDEDSDGQPDDETLYLTTGKAT